MHAHRLVDDAFQIVDAEVGTFNLGCARLNCAGVDQYSAFPKKDCAGRNEIGTIATNSGVDECKQRCSQDAACVSIEFYSGNSVCHLSSSCTASLMEISIDPTVTLYIKNLDIGAAVLPIPNCHDNCVWSSKNLDGYTMGYKECKGGRVTWL